MGPFVRTNPSPDDFDLDAKATAALDEARAMPLRTRAHGGDEKGWPFEKCSRYTRVVFCEAWPATEVGASGKIASNGAGSRIIVDPLLLAHTDFHAWFASRCFI